MKKLLLLLITGLAMVLHTGTVNAQTPQGFTYQAVLTKGDGSPVAGATIKVLLSVLTDTTGFKLTGSGNYLWEEQHLNVKTNDDGVFTVILGEGTKYGGSVASFNLINWSAGTYYVGVKVANPTNYKIMGAARLTSVPFSLVSARTEGVAEGTKLTLVSSDDASQDPLFEVKRKDGQTVFAVYNDAVNVFLPNSTAKAKRAGFAVGGFTKTKGTSQELFTVTSDSIRMYINDTPPPKAGSRGGFAIGGFNEAKGGRDRYLSLYGYSTVDTISNTSQIMWYPKKEAFLAGNIDILSPDSVGRNSFSTGYKNKAIGDYSHALGYQAIARGDYSTAIGRSAIAGNNSFALGNFSSALGNDSYALGSGSWAMGSTSIALGVGSGSSGEASMALGFQSEASFPYSVAIGYQSKAKAYTAHSFGLKAEATGYGAMALGMYSKAKSNFSTTLGYWSEANNEYSMALGFFAKALGRDSYSLGSYTEAGGERSFAIGSFGLKDDFTPNTLRPTRTTDYYSLAFGMGAQATALGAMSLGVNSTASGGQSISIGFGSTASAQFATAMGYRSFANGFKSISIGAHYNITFNKLVWQFNIATGTWIFVPTPITLDKSNVAEGDFSIAIGNGNYSKVGGLALGTNNSAFGFGSVALGHSNEADSAFALAAGFSNVASGLKAFALGEYLIAQSANSFVVGAFNVPEGKPDEWLPNDPLFVVGNGNPGTRSNAFKVLKNGNVVLSQNINVGTGMALSVDPATGLILKAPSSARYKTDINNIDDVAWLYELKPVTFRYKSDPYGTLQYGFVAEDVESINSELVLRSGGVPEGINYDGFTAPVIRALQQQRERIDELEISNVLLRSENELLRTRLEKLEESVKAIMSNKK